MFVTKGIVTSICRRNLKKCFFNFNNKQSNRFSSESEKNSGGNNSVLIEDRGHVRLIGLNRPEKRNAVNHTTAKQLRKAFEDFDQNPESYVAILHGIGGSFCAGYDLSELANQADESFSVEDLAIRGPMGPSQMLLSKPVVAAVDGYAVAGGFELALWCDLRVVETTAVMGVFCRRFGVPLIDGGTVRLSKLIGHSRALDLILTGRGINGKEAFEWGIANRLVPVGTALGQAYQLANSLVKFPQKCMRADRKSAYYATFDSATIEDALRYEFEESLYVIQEEAIQGAKRFSKENIGKHGKFVLDKIDYNVEVTV